MGWEFCRHASFEDWIGHLKDEYWRKKPDGTVVIVRCVADHLTFEHGTYVLWTVLRQTVHRGHRLIEPPRAWIHCNLLQLHPRHGWGAKILTEQMHPSLYSCPMRLLDLAEIRSPQWRRELKDRQRSASLRR